MDTISNPIYSRRKRFLPEYRELFTALLKIPDKDVRDRVTNAINGIQSCPNCRSKQHCQYIMHVGTQTEDKPVSPFKIDVGTQIEERDFMVKSVDGRKCRRKRKRNCPKVVKTAQHLSDFPILKQNNISKSQDRHHSVELQPRLQMRTDSNDDAVSMFFDNCSIDNLDIFQSPNTLETIKFRMKYEWENSTEFNERGFLPIHEAIVQNDIYMLRRQLYVWKFRKCDLMTLVTDEESDDIIQLALKCNCTKLVFDELLKEDLNLNLNKSYDGESNNIIHLAVTWLSSEGNALEQKNILHTLESLLKKVDIKKLLDKNDDGLTPLHITVKRNQYLMTEKILSVVDEILNLQNRVVSLNNPNADVQSFVCHYCKQCENFDAREAHTLKQDILNAVDMKRGCSMLYFAVELGYEHLIYLLLAHMCNPSIKNLAGLDAKTYYTDNGKNASISGVLEKLVSIYQNQ